MKILVVGASGYFGQSCLESLSRTFDVTGTYNSKKPASKNSYVHLDALSLDSIRGHLQENTYDVHIFAVGAPNPDFCESNIESAEALNTISVKNYVEVLCELQPKALLVFLSTAYVFDGYSVQKPLGELDSPQPGTVYSRTKLAGEEWAKNAGNFIIVRPPYIVGGNHPNNFILKAANQLMDSSNQVHRLESKEMRYPTATSDITSAILMAIEKGFTGVLHVCSPESLTRYDMYNAIEGQLKTGAKICPNGIYPDPNSWAVTAKRHPNLSLSNDTLDSWGFKFSTFNDEVERSLKYRNLGVDQ